MTLEQPSEMINIYLLKVTPRHHTNQLNAWVCVFAVSYLFIQKIEYLPR